MKFTKSLFISAMLTVSATAAIAQNDAQQDSTGLPGDNFSLTGALETFKKSTSPEDFEKQLNSEDSRVNNLDLNGDGEIDYIKVIDQKNGDSHALILQDAVSETENQDVAVIEIEKNGNENASVQIVGDKDLYGEELVVEPSGQEVTNQPASTQPQATQSITNVYAWPAVRYVYAPTYGVWMSPYRWAARPMWWHPWRPVAYRTFYPYRVAYHHRYVVGYQPRLVATHRAYTPVRTVSTSVQSRNQVRVTQYRATRTTSTAPSPNRNTVRKTTTRRATRTTRTRTRVKKN